MNISRFVTWLPRYDRAWFRFDPIAGLTLWGLVVPEVYFADVHAPVLERARETGLLEVVGDGHVFPTVDLAVREIEGYAAQPPGEDPDVSKHE